MALKYNESTGEFEEREELRKPEQKVPPPFIYDPREYTRVPPKPEPQKKAKGEDGCLSTLLSLFLGVLWLAIPYLILLGLASLCS